jgi:hydroxymethylpyrimidine pyrophosphatase-like HAD family hydrolase
MSGIAERPSGRSPDRVEAFAVDLDRTLIRPEAGDLRLAAQILRSVREMGLRVILVTGREYSALTRFSTRLRYVDALVAENGAVIEAPRGGRIRVVGRSTGVRVRQRLAQSHWTDFDHGLVVVSVAGAARRKIETILKGLEVAYVTNVDRVMILPKGVTKATGTRRALEALHLGSRPFAAVGDAENDLPLLRAAAVSGAVRNAQSRVRASVDHVSRESFTAGVAEFVRGPLARSLGGHVPRMTRSHPRG